MDIEPRNALDAFTLFGAPGTPLALAALRTKPVKEPPRQQLMSQWLAMRCEDAEFQKWLGVPDALTAAQRVRERLAIKSRAEIDTDPDALERFNRLIRIPWSQHNRQPA